MGKINYTFAVAEGRGISHPMSTLKMKLCLYRVISCMTQMKICLPRNVFPLLPEDAITWFNLITLKILFSITQKRGQKGYISGVSSFVSAPLVVLTPEFVFDGTRINYCIINNGSSNKLW
jgi:hypothetical protein